MGDGRCSTGLSIRGDGEIWRGSPNDGWLVTGAPVPYTRYRLYSILLTSSTLSKIRIKMLLRVILQTCKTDKDLERILNLAKAKGHQVRYGYVPRCRRGKKRRWQMPRSPRSSRRQTDREDFRLSMENRNRNRTEQNRHRHRHRQLRIDKAKRTDRTVGPQRIQTRTEVISSSAIDAEAWF